MCVYDMDECLADMNKMFFSKKMYVQKLFKLANPDYVHVTTFKSHKSSGKNQIFIMS